MKMGRNVYVPAHLHFTGHPTANCRQAFATMVTVHRRMVTVHWRCKRSELFGYCVAPHPANGSCGNEQHNSNDGQPNKAFDDKAQNGQDHPDNKQGNY